MRKWKKTVLLLKEDRYSFFFPFRIADWLEKYQISLFMYGFQWPDGLWNGKWPSCTSVTGWDAVFPRIMSWRWWRMKSADKSMEQPAKFNKRVKEERRAPD